MREFRNDPVRPAAQPIGSTDPNEVTRGQIDAWMFAGVDNLGELLGYVQARTLVPFESTFAVQQRGFYPALEAGLGALHPDSFDAMIDVQSARGMNVTPLPVLDSRA
jgi:hypothetical protein